MALQAWLGEPQALPQLSSHLRTVVLLRSRWHLHLCRWRGTEVDAERKTERYE